ncbi:MAG: response regulator, partial [Planctomycetota bacterium]
KRVLIVEDDDDLLFGLKEIFQSKEIDVFIAISAEQAMALLKTGVFDVVIADLMLGSSNPEGGLELIRYIKTHAEKTRTIVITGCGEPDIMDRVNAAGADLFFAKPVAAKVLKEAALRISA